MARRPAVHTIVTSRKLMRPPGPQVHGVVAENPGRTLWLSGQLPVVAATGKPLAGPVRNQTEAVFGQVRNLALDAGFSVEEMVFCRIYLTDLKHLPIVDELYRKLFVGQILPARTVLPVPALADGALLMVEAVLCRPAEEQAPAPMMPPDDYGY